MVKEHKLPIDVVPGTVPPRFVWYYHPPGAGLSPVKCEGIMVVSIEAAMIEMIGLTKQLQKENERLVGIIQARISDAAKEQSAAAEQLPPVEVMPPAPHRQHRRGR